MTRRKTVSAVALVALMLTAGFAVWGQEPRPSYTPEGAWLVKGSFGPVTFMWMDTYTSDSVHQGRSGTVLCTLPSAGMTASGHGVWTRVEKNKFAITAWRIMLNPNSQPVGLVKFWGTVTMTADDTTEGTLNAEYYDLEGKVLNTMTGGVSAGKRLVIQYE